MDYLTRGGRTGGMNARTLKILLWTMGMAFVGAIIGSKGSYSMTWYGTLKDSAVEILFGAGIGAILGYVFSRRLAKVSK